jgi:hypothetical protein
MKYISSNSDNIRSRNRVKEISILIPKIRAEFYVRLFSLLKSDPEVSEEGYEFFIKDNQTGKEFSAGLTGFGVGYFASENTTEILELISTFHNYLFQEFTELKECRIEIENDYGKSIFGYENEKIIEVDIEDE